jgi:gluconolactonase
MKGVSAMRLVGLALMTLTLAACAGGGNDTAAEETEQSPSDPSVRSLVAPGAKVKQFASGLQFAEGPLWLPDGRLIVSEVVGNAVLVFDAAGHKSDFRRPSNVANGHALDSDGSVVEAEMGGGTGQGMITRIAADGSVTVLADSFQGKRFNAPNDLIVKRDGTIWFTDPNFNASAAEIGFTGVYRLDPESKVVTLLTKTLTAPNGIAFSPDEKTLYVSDTTNSTIYSFPVAADSTLGPGKKFGVGCDGIGVDERGNVWATTCGPSLTITDPAGTQIRTVGVGGGTSNLAWGGADGRTLFVTTEGGDVYSLALTVRETH